MIPQSRANQRTVPHAPEGHHTAPQLPAGNSYAIPQAPAGYHTVPQAQVGHHRCLKHW